MVLQRLQRFCTKTTNSNSESQLTWQGNPFIPLTQALCPVDLLALQVVLAFWCEHCYWITVKPYNVLICSSSCTGPQGCCCERSEQQQTCFTNNLYNLLFLPQTPLLFVCILITYCHSMLFDIIICITYVIVWNFHNFSVSYS